MSTEAPPSYNELFPPTEADMSNFMQGRREGRYTTVTLRELRFPAGCPCHPTEPEKARSNSRKDLEPGQRVQSKLWRKFQVQKSTALGLVIPQSLQLEVRHVDKADQDLGPAYRTSKLNWPEMFVTMLPKFDLYVAHDDMISGVEDQSDLVAKIPRILWNCARKTLASAEMFQIDEALNFDHRLPSDIRRHWSIHQVGLKRHYNLVGRGKDADEPAKFAWKGSKHVINHLEDCNPPCHGNLKLLAGDGTLLAAWKQQRDRKVLGSIHVFEEARDVIPIEAIVVSCLCVIIVERTTGVTWFGGM